MFEFKWHVPGSPPSEVELQLHSRTGWFGRKFLLRDGRRVYRRGWFTGIETRLDAPGSPGPNLDLRILPIPGTHDWRPALFVNGVETPETTGTAPPRIVPPPKSLVLPVGLTYLLMAITAAMMPQMTTMLEAFNLRYDDRKAVLQVIDPQAPSIGLVVDAAELAPAVAGQPYAAALKAVGGTAPYRWSPVAEGWPRGWKLDAETGVLSGTPVEARDLILKIKVSDAAGRSAERPLALVVRSTSPRDGQSPAITTLTLPPATVGQPYDFTIERNGGQPPLSWKTMGKRRLPDGLKLDPQSGTIRGTPTKAGDFPVSIRMIDDYYSAARDITHWIAPFAATTLCLLGFLGMRKWSVYAYGALIALQAAGVFVFALPIAATALVPQAFLWLVGAAHLGKMR
jgi:hypothetical protein